MPEAERSVSFIFPGDDRPRCVGIVKAILLCDRNINPERNENR
jgi:hypothetical protein